MNDLYSLIEAVKQGDENAFSILLEQYKNAVDGAVRRFAPSFEITEGGGDGWCDIEDLRQYASLALYRAAATYVPGESGKGKEVSFGLYAKICINNSLISFLRKYRTQKKKRDAANNSEKITRSSAPGGTNDPLGLVVSGESAEEMVKQIKSSLSEYETAVFNCYIVGKSTEEIARELGRTEKSVINALYRVKVKIKGLLKK
ncbi:MAG: sigma-70 family RNA polymerase sigma factor [Ruminococcaceae bacterium]|nr:sigma-70 family RNA polymerase sigma factor [Oscillospiraceae bacterium]